MAEKAHFYACHADWRTHSGVGPTQRQGKLFRPVAHLKTKTARCEFCGEIRIGVFRYEEVER